MTDREEKLNKIRSKQAALTIVTDGEPLIEALQSKINELKKALETDIEVNVDDLINELKRIESIAPTIKSLVEAIDAIEIPPIPEIPESIEVKGLTYVVETLDKQINYLKQIADFKMPDVNIKVETISKQNTEMINKKLDEVIKSSRIDLTNLLDKQSIIEVTKRLDDLIQVVSKNVTSQNAEDYMPTRRVVKIGNKLLFDDSVTGGGGGGGGIPRDLTRVNETAIAVVNPDGTNIGGGSSGGAVTNDGTFATPARQDTGNTSLSTIAGAVSASVVQGNVKQINGVTPLMGNGATGTGSQRVTVASDNTPFAVKTDQTTHGTTDLVASDQTKVAGTAVDVNSGNKSAGTQRFVLATDQPQLTNALKVDGSATTQPISAASLPLPTGAATSANQSTEITSLSTIVTNTGNSATSANQTNGNQQSRITDGTNIASVMSGDTGFNGVVTGSATKTISFSTSTPGAQIVLPATAVTGYGWVEVIHSSVGVGLTLTGQYSALSGGTYINSSTFANGAGAANGGLGTTVNTIYHSAIHGNFFQINVTALTSGTFSGTVILHAYPFPLTATVIASQAGTWNVGSNSATGSAVPANAFYMGLSDGTNLRGATGNIDTAALITASGATTTQTGADQTNFNAKGVKVVLDMTTVGTGSVTLEIDGKDVASGKYYAILTGAAVVTNSTNVYTIYPGTTATANVSVSDILPKVWRVKVTANNTNATTYTVGASVIL